MGTVNSLATQVGESGATVAPVTLVDANGNALSSNTNGQNTRANSAPVTIASDQTPLVMASPTVTQVASSASTGTILAANANRRGALFFNDSTATLYLLYGTGTASTTNYTVKIGPQVLFELPASPVFTGQLTGIWSAANGYVYVTEVVA